MVAQQAVVLQESVLIGKDNHCQRPQSPITKSVYILGARPSRTHNHRILTCSTNCHPILCIKHNNIPILVIPRLTGRDINGIHVLIIIHMQCSRDLLQQRRIMPIEPDGTLAIRPYPSSQHRHLHPLHTDR